MESSAEFEFVDEALRSIGDTRFNDWLFAQLAPVIRPGHILEIGSGSGNISALLMNNERVCLTDNDPRYLERLRERFPGAHVDVMPLDLEDVAVKDFAQKKFTSILCVNVLEHVLNDAGALERVATLMEPDTKFVLLVPAHQALYGRLDEMAGHHRRYEKASLQRLLADSGHRVVSTQYFNRLSALGWWFKGRLLRRDTISRSDLRAVELLFPLMKLFERLPLPYGQSLIVVTERDSTHR